MPNAGVKVGEKLYLPGLPVLFLQANSKKQQKRKQNRKSGIVRKAESNATICNAQSITSVWFS